jgi:hypothetical protein
MGYEPINFLAYFSIVIHFGVWCTRTLDVLGDGLILSGVLKVFQKPSLPPSKNNKRRMTTSMKDWVK